AGDRNPCRSAWEDQTPPKAHLPFAQKIAVTLIRFDGAAEARVLPHRPKPSAVHAGINSARVRKFTREAECLLRIPVLERMGSVQTLQRQARKSGKARLAFRGCFGLS